MCAAPFNTPPTWSNGPLTLYHGTLIRHKASLAAGINPALGRSHTDFGIGFYTTTLLDQAKSWAWDAAHKSIAAGDSSARGCVLAFTLDRNQAASLHSLAFVRGDRDADDFWSLIFHCRQGLPGHGRSGPKPEYDIVYGPVAAFWQQRVLMMNADQISFHTPAGANLLVHQPSLTIDL